MSRTESLNEFAKLTDATETDTDTDTNTNTDKIADTDTVSLCTAALK